MKTTKKYLCFALFASGVLFGCGGGSSPALEPAVPNVTATLSSAKISTGGSVMLQWSSTNAESCAIPELAAAGLPTKGSKIIAARIVGSFTYTVSCKGPSGDAVQSVVLSVIPKLGSYENKIAARLVSPHLPWSYEINNIAPENGEYSFNLRSVAFGDFLGTGEIVGLTSSFIYRNVYPGSNPQKFGDSPSKLYFLRRDASGSWSDATDQFIKASADRYICVNPGFIEVADLNGDGRVDAAFGCTGPDFQINGIWDDSSIQYILLSQADGTYKLASIPIGKIYGHQSTIADIDLDGNLDILSVDPYNYRTPIVLWGKGDGTFTIDSTRFPKEMFDKHIYGIRAIPIDGELNILVSGPAPGSAASSHAWEYGFKVLKYSDGAFKITHDLTGAIPMSSLTGRPYSMALDVIYANKRLYAIFVTDDYSQYAVISFDLVSGIATILAERTKVNGSDNSGVLTLNALGMLMFQMTSCGVSSANVTDPMYWECNFSLQPS